MVSARQQRRMSFPTRVLLFAIGVVAGGFVVFLLVPESAVSAGLGWYFPPEQYRLDDPQLLLTWRLIVSVAAGVLLCLTLAVLLAAARRRRRVRAEAALPEPVRALRRAVKAGDLPALAEACRRLGTEAGPEAVPELLAALERVPEPTAQQSIAAALFQLGRVTTAEVSSGPVR